MDARDRDDGDGINQYWDALVTGVRRTGHDVDPAVVRQIDGLHARGPQSGADPVFLQRLRHELTAWPTPVIDPAPHVVGREWAPVNGRAAADGRPRRRRRVTAFVPGWRPARLALALVLLAVVVGGGSVYRQERHAARLAAVVNGVPTTDLSMTVFDELEGVDVHLVSLDPITLTDRPGRDTLTLAGRIAVSSDGSTMATVDSPAPDGQPSKMTTVVVLDGSTGIEQRRFEVPGASYGRPRLSRDGSRLVLNGGQDGAGLDGRATFFQVIDTSDGRVIAPVPDQMGDEWPVETWIDPDATRLYSLFLPHTQTNTGPGPTLIVAHDLGTGAEVGRIELPEVRGGTWSTDRTVTPNESTGALSVMASLVPGVALSPDGATIALAHADAEVITLVDTRRLTVKRSVALEPPHTMGDRLLAFVPFLPQPVAAKMLPEGTTVSVVFGTDGQHLYLMGRTTNYGDDGQPVVESIGLRGVDLRDGTEVVANSGGEWLQVFPSTDGRTLYALRYRASSSGPVMLQRLDTETLAIKVERQVPGVGYPQLFLRPSVPNGSDALR